jgi:MOSC domain-containing protein YiiM
MAHVESVNVGAVRTIEWQGRTVTTGIWKSPVEGRIAVRATNLDGDRQADLRVHGGPDKAVYAYAVEDYEWWSGELAMPVAPATFGENLTTSGAELDGAIIGTRWRVGGTLLEVAQPRLPCFKLGIRMDDPTFKDRFEAAARFGAYLRVIAEGDIGRGDPIEVVDAPPTGITVRELARAERGDRSLLRRVLDDPAVPGSWKDWAERGLARVE